MKIAGGEAHTVAGAFNAALESANVTDKSARARRLRAVIGN